MEQPDGGICEPRDQLFEDPRVTVAYYIDRGQIQIVARELPRNANLGRAVHGRSFVSMRRVTVSSGKGNIWHGV